MDKDTNPNDKNNQDNDDNVDKNANQNANQKPRSKYYILLIICSIIIGISLLLAIFFMKRTWRLHVSGVERKAGQIVKNGPPESRDLLIGLASTSNWHFSLICCIIPLIIYFTIIQVFPNPDSNTMKCDYIAVEVAKALFLWCLMAFTISKAITFLQVHCINPVGGPSFT